MIRSAHNSVARLCFIVLMILSSYGEAVETDTEETKERIETSKTIDANSSSNPRTYSIRYEANRWRYDTVDSEYFICPGEYRTYRGHRKCREGVGWNPSFTGNYKSADELPLQVALEDNARSAVAIKHVDHPAISGDPDNYLKIYYSQVTDVERTVYVAPKGTDQQKDSSLKKIDYGTSFINAFTTVLFFATAILGGVAIAKIIAGPSGEERLLDSMTRVQSDSEVSGSSGNSDQQDPPPLVCVKESQPEADPVSAVSSSNKNKRKVVLGD